MYAAVFDTMNHKQEGTSKVAVMRTYVCASLYPLPVLGMALTVIVFNGHCSGGSVRACCHGNHTSLHIVNNSEGNKEVFVALDNVIVIDDNMDSDRCHSEWYNHLTGHSFKVTCFM